MPINPFAFNRVFQGIIQFANEKYGENEYSIKSYSIYSPCSDQDNFLSEIYSIRLEIALKSPKNCKDTTGVKVHELIAKSQIVDADSDTDSRRYAFNLIFTKEKLLYSDVLKSMENLLSEINGYEESFVGPQMYTFYAEGDTYSCLLMENLVAQGFYTPETHGTGVGLEECKSIMKAMARFHALSLVMEGQNQIPFSQKQPICSTAFLLNPATASAVMPVIQGSYSGIIDLAQKYRPDLVQLLTQLDQEEVIWDRLSKLVQPGMSSFSCLCHGDPRLKNIFINREDSSMVRFIDFQLTRYCSPLTDLQYILYMGATKEFRTKHTDQVLQAYHQEFTVILNSFPSVKLLPDQEAAVKGWTFEKLKEEYEGMFMYGFLISMALLPIILLRPGDIDKAVTQMSKDERQKFYREGRRTMVFELGCKHQDVRERLFDICDEAFARMKNKKE